MTFQQRILKYKEQIRVYKCQCPNTFRFCRSQEITSCNVKGYSQKEWVNVFSANSKLSKVTNLKTLICVKYIHHFSLENIYIPKFTKLVMLASTFYLTAQGLKELHCKMLCRRQWLCEGLVTPYTWSWTYVDRYSC